MARISLALAIAFALTACAPTAPAPAADDAPAWKLTRSLPAAEAHQAAAADKEHVYAITNDRVARYDRKTGERLAVSTGEAKHLNSGFLLEGRLYCAHSNYPQTPEQSDIKVLDLATMKLSTFKEFNDFGGSLTWAVREGDAWWCNFARYGDENAGTFLVRFDDAWREKGRWTYPPEVLRGIGKMSLSGGIFRQGSLLVTDHDNPVIYCLRVPQQGSVLEFIEQQSAPITGQGIAFDPATGGIVGISRPKKEVIFAEWAENKAASAPVKP